MSRMFTTALSAGALGALIAFAGSAIAADAGKCTIAKDEGRQPRRQGL